MYGKKEAYHVLRDEWLKSSKNRLDSMPHVGSSSEVGKAVYNSAVKELAAEIAISKYYASADRHPYGNGEHERYTDKDRGKEKARYERCKKIMIDRKRSDPGLEEAVNR